MDNNNFNNLFGLNTGEGMEPKKEETTPTPEVNNEVAPAVVNPFVEVAEEVIAPTVDLNVVSQPQEVAAPVVEVAPVEMAIPEVNIEPAPVVAQPSFEMPAPTMEPVIEPVTIEPAVALAPEATVVEAPIVPEIPVEPVVAFPEPVVDNSANVQPVMPVVPNAPSEDTFTEGFKPNDFGKVGTEPAPQVSEETKPIMISSEVATPTPGEAIPVKKTKVGGLVAILILLLVAIGVLAYWFLSNK